MFPHKLTLPYCHISPHNKLYGCLLFRFLISLLLSTLIIPHQKFAVACFSTSKLTVACFFTFPHKLSVACCSVFPLLCTPVFLPGRRSPGFSAIIFIHLSPSPHLRTLLSFPFSFIFIFRLLLCFLLLYTFFFFTI